MVDENTIPEGAQCSRWGRSMSEAFPEHIVKRMIEDGVLSEGCLATEETEEYGTAEQMEERIDELKERLGKLQERKSEQQSEEQEEAEELQREG